MKISVVIPVYKNKKMFFDNLRANYQFIKDCEIVIVDDSSGEEIEKELKEKFPKIKYIENRSNLGFAKSVNIGIKDSQGDMVLLLNSDVRLFDDSFKKSTDLFIKDSLLFAVSFLQIGEGDSKSGKNKIYFEKGLFYHAKSDNLKFGITAWAEGGSSIFRSSFLNELGGFDEIYTPFYWEDIDLSYRAYKRGWKVIFDPSVKVLHKHESTIGKFYDKNYIRNISLRNQLIFTWKNIADLNKILEHIFLLPYNFFTGLSKAFFLAFLKLKMILGQRIKAINKLTDDEILLLFR